MIKLWINGEAETLTAGTTITMLLVAKGLSESRIAVEVNAAVVPRSQHGHTTLQSGDRVEIVHALGGG